MREALDVNVLYELTIWYTSMFGNQTIQLSFAYILVS